MSTPATDWSKFVGHPALQKIRDLMSDPEVSEIMINGPAQVYAERAGVMQPAAIRFRDDGELMLAVQALLQPTGREVSTSAPYMDFRLPDGTRGNVIIPPLAINGIVVTLRKFTRHLTKVEDLVARKTFSAAMGQFLIAAIKARANIVFAGATGTGKTTTLGILSQHIPVSERIITIEDTAELQLQQPHVVRLECRRPNNEGKGEVTLAELIRNSLRMHPIRIIVGEIRGEEAADMIQAIATGHHGCLAVLHASCPEDTISRLETMLLSRGLPLPLWAIHRQIASTIDLIVQQEMLPDGGRKVTRITEVAGAQENGVILRDLYEYRRSEEGEGWYCAGVTPRLAAKCDRMGVELPPHLYAKGYQ